MTWDCCASRIVEGESLAWLKMVVSVLGGRSSVEER